MKKWITTIALTAAVLFSLTGCGNKSEISISVEGIGDYEMVEIPTGVVNFSHTQDGITLTVEENGEYEFAIKDSDGNEYSFTLDYQDKTAEVTTDSDIDVKVSIK